MGFWNSGKFVGFLIGVTHSLEDWVLFVCNPRTSTHIFVASGAERVLLNLWFSCASVSPFVSSVSFFFPPPLLLFGLQKSDAGISVKKVVKVGGWGMAFIMFEFFPCVCVCIYILDSQ